ncbi:MAG: hypothetical protein COV74_07110 [Candidatus Omnitrophica bacterium CG11_big_fil_rev_8_21_14_0_20_45_26]|uniref:Uncharacterized protein n=1 Tax=Candidatus Abzuiibacterium crystallinum TaxID=1974748 RepID=A0A2H0LNC1_9BACT|nr:MAG: hypothetical protein COV74_07110 [Candidatus Omnitrophica bacterium CG11_big_fil_rev_8_21_14_0_20_45_26]PIW63453.1 MAG: hypothetical protein COW12_10450 [Candidatus Omnitrophica bacterium CG12_big_fil_rev_8_21_14_0_65_45_16]
MNQAQIRRFFKQLSRRYPHGCRIILTGAAGGALLGRVRATMDIDFAVRLRTKKSKHRQWQVFERAVRQAALQTGIAAQYAEDIDRWSMIHFLDYDRHTIPFEKFGKIEVHILDPIYWAIGKLARYLDPDIRDLVQVLKKKQPLWRKAVRIWGKALRKSPKSTACYLFRRHVEDFLTAYGPVIWRRAFDGKLAVQMFRRSAGIRV